MKKLAVAEMEAPKPFIDGKILSNLKAKFMDVCMEKSMRMVLSVCDVEGDELLNHRMEGAWLGSVSIARNKAYTALAFSGPDEASGLPTSELAKLAQPGKDLYGIQNTNQGRIVIFGGGYPVYIDGVLVGGLGVSGSTVEDDMTVAEATLSVLKAQP